MSDVVRIAAFDVDGTLTTHDCVVPFLRRIGGTVGVAKRCLRSPIVLGSALARRDRDTVKAIGARAAFAGRSIADVDVAGKAFAAEVYEGRLRGDIVAELDRHREVGAIVVLVSASFEVYLRPLAALLGVNDVLAARLETGGDGTYTGELLGPNCRGLEKVVRLHGWLDERHGGRSAAHVTAYGDSAGDRELLADADEAHWVGTKPHVAVPRVLGSRERRSAP